MADICVFAGQGAQVPGMGKDFAEDPEIMKLFETANSVLGFDLAKYCFEGPAEELMKSNICQPAIFTVSYAAWVSLQKKRPTEFAAAGGLSLGEWSALCAAGVLDFESTLKVLEARGRFMQEACVATPSGMIAVMRATPEQLDQICEKTGCTKANINSSAQVVLSGSKDAIAAAEAEAKALGVRASVLATAGGFHSQFMAPAREKLAPILDGITFNAPKIPVLSNVTGKVHSNDPAEIKAVMLRQVTETTNWAGDIETAREMGASRFVEFGPGNVLSGLIRRIDKAFVCMNVSDVATLESTVAAL
jgi:[acyl-carrier-protein] S-malonyltransferase